ncbi:hypothetical protein HAQ01_00495, partial [Acidithiobacillus thiooxidans]|uniref:hypothetical protein n=2 Tax=Acidithiobacillus TaxID=119977 RepID=UPI001C065D90
VNRLRALSNYQHDDLSIAEEAAEEIERLRARFWTSQKPNTHASTDDYTVSDSEVAESILRYLGFAVEPSLEPYVDRKRDHVAQIVRAAIDADRRLRNGL